MYTIDDIVNLAGQLNSDGLCALYHTVRGMTCNRKFRQTKVKPTLKELESKMDIAIDMANRPIRG